MTRVSIKIYSNFLGAQWISMVQISSYQWWSAKIPREKSKRPIAMQPCPKSHEDSIPQPIKSLVFSMHSSSPKGCHNDILLATSLIRLAATFLCIFHVALNGNGCTSSISSRSWSPFPKLLLLPTATSFSSGEVITAPARGTYLSTVSTLGHRKKSSARACIPGGDLISPKMLLRFACHYFASCSWPSALRLECSEPLQSGRKVPNDGWRTLPRRGIWKMCFPQSELASDAIRCL